MSPPLTSKSRCHSSNSPGLKANNPGQKSIKSNANRKQGWWTPVPHMCTVLFSIQLKAFFQKNKKNYKMAIHSPGETDIFFSLAYAIQNTTYIIQEGICQCYFYWHQLVLYYIFWDSLCAVINIPGYHSDQHLFNIYVGSELKIIKKKNNKPILHTLLEKPWQFQIRHPGSLKTDKNTWLGTKQRNIKIFCRWGWPR